MIKDSKKLRYVVYGAVVCTLAMAIWYLYSDYVMAVDKKQMWLFGGLCVMFAVGIVLMLLPMFKRDGPLLPKTLAPSPSHFPTPR